MNTATQTNPTDLSQAISNLQTELGRLELDRTAIPLSDVDRLVLVESQINGKRSVLDRLKNEKVRLEREARLTQTAKRKERDVALLVDLARDAQTALEAARQSQKQLNDLLESHCQNMATLKKSIFSFWARASTINDSASLAYQAGWNQRPDDKAKELLGKVREQVDLEPVYIKQVDGFSSLSGLMDAKRILDVEQKENLQGAINAALETIHKDVDTLAKLGLWKG